MLQTKRSGFTLVEVLVAVGLGVMVAMFVTTLALDALRATAEIKRSERLHADVIHLTSRVGYLIKQGADINTDPTVITITMLDLTTSEIRYADGSILINGSPVFDDRIEIVSFTAEGARNSVQLNFIVTYRGSDKEHSFVTTLARRNII